MDQYRERFQRLLRELFQFDCADLDFGIYRIMNFRREAIEKGDIENYHRIVKMGHEHAERKGID